MLYVVRYTIHWKHVIMVIKCSVLVSRDFVNTRLLVHKHVKISVDECILETSGPHKHVKFLEEIYVP